MNKYILEKECDVQGRLRFGHLEIKIEAKSREEAIEKASKSDDYKIIVDDYSIDDYTTYGKWKVIKEVNND